MGNHFSKKRCPTTSNFHEVFVSCKLISEDKDSYDEKEHSCHILLREIFKGNFSSPIHDVLSNPNTKILDIGCGNGYWLMEMAADYPKPRYFGVDILSNFPKSTHPSNVEFLQRNLLNGLPYEDNTFDFIHMQFLVCDFTELQWVNIIYKELARILKPGGWCELADPEFKFMNSGPLSDQINDAVRDNLVSRNVNPLIVRQHHSLIKSVTSFSLKTVHYERQNFPLSSQTNKVGKLGGFYLREQCRSALRGPVGKDMNIKEKNINSFMDKLSNEFELNQTYFYFHRFYIQKFQKS